LRPIAFAVTEEVRRDIVPEAANEAVVPTFPIYVALFALSFLLLYLPIILDAGKYWAKSDNYSHGFLVLPCSLYLIWLRRDEIKRAVPAPTLWGALPLTVGLLMQVASYILQIKYVGMWSMVLTLTGAIYLLHGPALWKICRFSVLFTLFAAPLPNTFLYGVTSILQTVSTVGSTSAMSALGFQATYHGNVIEVPGATLEIANACSGFHSIISMLAFVSIYAYLFTSDYVKRAILVAVTVPVALAANIASISILILAANYGGMRGYHMFHDPAALVEIIVDFLVLVYIGRSLGCDNLRFVQQPAV
jgi:exosortase